MHRGRRWVVRRHGQDRDRVHVARSTIPDDANRETAVLRRRGTTDTCTPTRGRNS
jgi:hypothetical protein